MVSSALYAEKVEIHVNNNTDHTIVFGGEKIDSHGHIVLMNEDREFVKSYTLNDGTKISLAKASSGAKAHKLASDILGPYAVKVSNEIPRSGTQVEEMLFTL